MSSLHVNRRIRKGIVTMLKVVSCIVLTACVLGIGVSGEAIAGSDSGAADIELSRAADELDETFGAGTSDQIKGKAQSDIGAVKRAVGKATGQAEGTADQIKGRAQQDIGKVKQAADSASDSLQDKLSDAVDTVQDFFD